MKGKGYTSVDHHITCFTNVGLIIRLPIQLHIRVFRGYSYRNEASTECSYPTCFSTDDFINFGLASHIQSDTTLQFFQTAVLQFTNGQE